MRYIGISILLVLCLTLLLLTGCMINTVTPEIDMGNSNNPSSNNPNSNNYQNPSTDSVEETVIMATEESATTSSSNNPNSNNYQNPSTDSVEGSATEEPGTVKVDTTKPFITGSRAPLPNSFGWNNTDVTVSFSCTDTGSVQSGIEINTVAGKTLTTEGKNQSVTNTGVCIDAAGNVADPVTVSNINIDKTPPVVMITLPGAGEYVLNQSITATWSATDALSGVVSPVSGSVSIDTSSVGTNKTFTLPAGTAKDKAGNSSLIVTKSYSVIADTEEPVIVDSEDPEMIYPQKWATGTGTAGDPWAGDCINDAYTACPTGGTIYMRAGYYALSTSTLYLNKAINLIGEGIGKTILVTPDDYGIQIGGDSVTCKGFTIDGAAQTENAATSYCIDISGHNYITLEDIEVKNCGRIGINSLNTNYSLFQNLYIHDCKSHGMHPGGSEVGRNQYNTYNNIFSYNNGGNGFDDYSNPEIVFSENNTYKNLDCRDNAEAGIAITSQIGITLSNSLTSGNGISGMELASISNATFSDCLVNYSGSYGIIIKNSSKNVNFTNVIAKNNATGIYIITGENIAFTTCQSYDDRETLLQKYGLELYGTNTGISLLNCTLSPNKDGEIYNPAGAVVTVITEKMLAKF